MATKRWRGDGKNTAQVNTITPANVAIGNTFSTTINGKSITFTATAATVANVTAGAVALLNASEIPEFAEITWADGTTAITGTADTASKPFTQTSSATGGTATFTTSTTTANTSAHDVNDGANWSDGSVPGASDTIIVENTSSSLLYNLGSLSGTTVTSWTFEETFTGECGLPEFTATGYQEYRATYLAIGITTLTIRCDSGRIKVNGGSVQTTVNIDGSGSPSETGVHAIVWKGTHASNVVNITKGSLDVAPFVISGTAETATIATLRIGYQTSAASDVQVRLSSGVTLTTIEKSGGTLEVNSAVTTLNQTEGDTTIKAGAITTLNLRGGRVYYNGTGTLTTATVTGNGVLDFSQDMRAKTVTNPIELYGDDATLLDPYQVVGSLIVDMNNRRKFGDLDLGINIRLTRGTPA